AFDRWHEFGRWYARIGPVSPRCGSHFQQDCPWSDIDALHQHPGLEPSGGHRGTPVAQRISERLDQWFGDLGRGRGRPARPPSLARVAVEGELADDEYRRADLGRGPLVVEDAQL